VSYFIEDMDRSHRQERQGMFGELPWRAEFREEARALRVRIAGESDEPIEVIIPDGVGEKAGTLANVQPGSG
jgi:hypothetical protein